MQDLSQLELSHPGWLARLLTHPIHGLDRFREMIEVLTSGRGAITVYCEVAPLHERSMR